MKKALAMVGLLVSLPLVLFVVRGLALGLLSFLKGGAYEISYAVTTLVFTLLVGGVVFYLVRWCVRSLRS